MPSEINELFTCDRSSASVHQTTMSKEFKNQTHAQQITVIIRSVQIYTPICARVVAYTSFR
jgi:hypothetical protein